MITEQTYNMLKKRNDEAILKNDYSNMIMIGDSDYKRMKEYEQAFICKHTSIEEIQGGQIERCNQCGKEWS